MAARKNLSHPERVRQRIRTTQLVKRLKAHALGEVEMTSTQVKAAEILLKKTLPDLSAVEHSGTTTQKHVTEYSEAELTAELEALRAVIAGAAATNSGTQDDSSVH